MKIGYKVLCLAVVLNCCTLFRFGCIWNGHGCLLPDAWTLTGLCFGLVLLDIYRLRPSSVHNARSLIIQYLIQTILYWFGLIFHIRLKLMSYNVQKQQSTLLKSIIDQNKYTKCAQMFATDTIKDVEDFLQKVPLTTYREYEILANDVEANGSLDVFFPGKCEYIALTSGTVSGRSKKIAKSINILRKTTGKWIILAQKLFMQIPRNNLLRKWLVVRIQPNCWTSTSGIKCGPISGISGSFSLNYYVAPKIMSQVMGDLNVIYCNLVFGLSDSEICNLFFSTSVVALLFFTNLEKRWEQICNDIETGEISKDLNIPEDIRQALSSHLHGPNPSRANIVRTEFLKGFQNIVPRVWPTCSGLFCLATGSFEFQASILKDTYLGDVPIFSPFHAGTETMYGFNLHLREPDVTYVAMTPYNFFEFIPLEDIEKDKPSVKLAHEVEVGGVYEIVITTWEGLYRYRTEDIIQITGFYGTIPRYRFIRRAGDILSVNTDRVPEVFLAAAVNIAVARWNRSLIDFTSTESCNIDKILDHVSETPYYIVFLEMHDDVQGLTSIEKKMVDDELIKQHEMYAKYRASGRLAEVKVVQLRQGVFERFRQVVIEQNKDTTTMQYKLPRITRRVHLLNLLLDNTLEKI